MSRSGNLSQGRSPGRSRRSRRSILENLEDSDQPRLSPERKDLEESLMDEMEEMEEEKGFEQCLEKQKRNAHRGCYTRCENIFHKVIIFIAVIFLFVISALAFESVARVSQDREEVTGLDDQEIQRLDNIYFIYWTIAIVSIVFAVLLLVFGLVSLFWIGGPRKRVGCGRGLMMAQSIMAVLGITVLFILGILAAVVVIHSRTPVFDDDRYYNRSLSLVILAGASGAGLALGLGLSSICR